MNMFEKFVKFEDWYFSGKCLKHPIVVGVFCFLLGYLLASC